MSFSALYSRLCGRLYAVKLSIARALATRRKIKANYAPPVKIYATILGFAAVILTSCSRAVFITESAPARVGADCRARVYTLDSSGEWILSDNIVTIPEGYFIVSPQWVIEKK